jgi:hypothetical protein
LRVFIKVKIKIILNYFEVVNVRLVNGASSNGGIHNSSSSRSSNSSSGSVRVVGESESISPLSIYRRFDDNNSDFELPNIDFLN